MKKVLFALALMAAPVLAGCRAPSATTHTVNITWTAPAPGGNWTGCGTPSTCAFAVYRAPTISGSCQASTSAAYQEVTTPSARPTGTSWQDLTATGLNVCYLAETVQSDAGTIGYSGPSNVAGPVAVPGTPLAPNLAAPTAATLVKPALPLPSAQPGIYARNFAPMNPGTLMARLNPGR